MRFKKNQMIVLIAAFIAVIAFRVVMNRTTLLVNTEQEVPEGYLGLQDYVLIDTATGKSVNPIHSLDFDSMDQYSFYGSSKPLQTTKGISNDSSWQDLLDAYGDYYADIISASLPYNSETYDSSQGIYENDITLNEFNEKYIKTGKVSLDTYNISISYSASTRLTRIYYTNEERLDAMYDANSLFWNFKIHTFQLSFSYECKEDEFNETGKGIIDYISSDRWSYD